MYLLEFGGLPLLIRHPVDDGLMRLSRVELERFRAYPGAVLELPETGIVVITGPNNAGKSALLSAVDVAGGHLSR